MLLDNIKKIRRAHFGWSKWGGANREFIKEESDEWTCQACAARHTLDVPSFNMEIFEEEFAKICSKCQNIKATEEIIEFDILIQKVRIYVS